MIPPNNSRTFTELDRLYLRQSKTEPGVGKLTRDETVALCLKYRMYSATVAESILNGTVLDREVRVEHEAKVPVQ